MIKYFVVIFVFISSAVDAHSIPGCYWRSDSISNIVSEESKVMISFVEITKAKDSNKYFANGMIWGANFHLCSVESETGPIPLTKQKGILVFTETDTEHDILCRLEISINDNILRIRDKNYHCSRQVMACGARISLDEQELTRGSQEMCRGKL